MRNRPLQFDRLRPHRTIVRGAGLIELMVALTIGLVSMLVIFQVFSVSEAYRRNTTGTSAAQQNGVFSMLAVSIDLANAGNALSLAAAELASCPNTGDPATTLRPIPVIINGGATVSDSDSIVATYSVARSVVVPVSFMATTAAGANSFGVQSPNGFAVGSRVIAINPSSARCMTTVVADRSPKMPPLEAVADKGRIDLTLAATATGEFSTDSYLIDMGPSDGPQRTLFDVTGNMLQSTDLFAASPVASSLADNVVLMKAQYGIDTSNPPDDIVDDWVPASAAWSRDSVLAATLEQLTRIKAIRIGMVVRSEQFDKTITGTTRWTLFDCHDGGGSCPRRISGDLPANWRYRTYETVIPLRNQLWNGASL